MLVCVRALRAQRDHRAERTLRHKNLVLMTGSRFSICEGSGSRAGFDTGRLAVRSLTVD